VRWLGHDIFKYEVGGNPVTGYGLLVFTDADRTVPAVVYDSPLAAGAVEVPQPIEGDDRSMVNLYMVPGHYYFTVTDNGGSAADLLTTNSVAFDDDTSIDYAIQPNMANWNGLELFSLNAYGAKDGDTAANKTAVRLAFGDLVANGSGFLYLPHGNYDLDDVTYQGDEVVHLDDTLGPFRLGGDGKGLSVIRQTGDWGGDNNFLSALGRHNVSNDFRRLDDMVDNITIQGDRTYIGNGIGMWQEENLVIRDVALNDFRGTALKFTSVRAPFVRGLTIARSGDRATSSPALWLSNSDEGGTVVGHTEDGDMQVVVRDSYDVGIYSRGSLRMKVAALVSGSALDKPAVSLLDDQLGDWRIRGKGAGKSIVEVRSTNPLRAYGTRITGSYDGAGAWGVRFIQAFPADSQFPGYVVDGAAGLETANASGGFSLPETDDVILAATARSNDTPKWDRARRSDPNVVNVNVANLGTYAPDLSKGTKFVITATTNGGASAITIADPINGYEGLPFRIMVVNNAGGVLTITWGAGYKFPAAGCTQATRAPANTKKTGTIFDKTANGADCVGCSGGDI
jgi:hypothetical protein